MRWDGNGRQGGLRLRQGNALKSGGCVQEGQTSLWEVGVEEVEELNNPREFQWNVWGLSRGDL